MKKTIRILLFFLLLAVACRFAAGAETVEDLYNEQLEASGGEELLRDLPDETRRLLDKLGITGLEMDTFSNLKPQSVWNQMLSLFSSQAGSPVRACGVVLGIILLCAWMDGLKHTVREPGSSEVFGVICALAACGTVIVPIVSCIRSVSEAAESASIFMTSYVPVYAGVLLTSGQAATAVSYQSVVLFAAELISLLASGVVVPLMTISLALGLTGSVTPGMKLDAAGNLMSKAAAWLLGLCCTLFVGLLSLQSLAGARRGHPRGAGGEIHPVEFCAGGGQLAGGGVFDYPELPASAQVHPRRLRDPGNGTDRAAAAARMCRVDIGAQPVRHGVRDVRPDHTDHAAQSRAVGGENPDRRPRRLRDVPDRLHRHRHHVHAGRMRAGEKRGKPYGRDQGLGGGAVCGGDRLRPDADAGAQGRPGKNLQTVLGAFLCCMAMPLLELGSITSLHVDSLPGDVTNELLQEKVDAQLRRQVEATVRQMAERRSKTGEPKRRKSP